MNERATIIVLYDSAFGNTAKVAEAIAEGIGDRAVLIRASESDTTDWTTVALLVAGSPTQGGRPTKGFQTFLAHIPAGALRDVPVAAFDTRFATRNHGVWLRFLMTVIGYAAERIGVALERAGGKLIAKPAGFIVTGKEGPLAEGEMERARAWGRILSERQGNDSKVATAG